MIARPVPHADLDSRTEAELVRARLRQRPNALAHGESCDRAASGSGPGPRRSGGRAGTLFAKAAWYSRCHWLCRRPALRNWRCDMPVLTQPPSAARRRLATALQALPPGAIVLDLSVIRHIAQLSCVVIAATQGGATPAVAAPDDEEAA